MKALDLQELAVQMLQLPPSIPVRIWVVYPREYAMAVWVSRLYGYDLAVDLSPIVLSDRRDSPTASFSRVDEPAARRRAEWMRNPAADPTYPPPVAWHLNGGPGFCPPGWHPAARLVITPEVERSLRYNEYEYRRRIRDKVGAKNPPRRRPGPELPAAPPPPPPPDTIAYPDEDRRS